MGIWAGIKHALNSTLGTADFKPLDKLNYEAIKAQRSLYASDEVHLTLDGLGTSTSYEHEVIKSSQKITTFSSGSIKLKMYHTFFNNVGGLFIVYKNGAQVASCSITGNGDDETSVTVQVSYVKGDVITWGVELYAIGSRFFRSNKVEILGTLTEFSPLDIT